MLRRVGDPADAGLPYVLADVASRYVIATISGSALTGRPGDAVPLARITPRTAATRCDDWLELGDFEIRDER